MGWTAPVKLSLCGAAWNLVHGRNTPSNVAFMHDLLLSCATHSAYMDGLGYICGRLRLSHAQLSQGSVSSLCTECSVQDLVLPP